MNKNSNPVTKSKTWSEIHSQPQIWREWADTLDVAGLREWVKSQGIKNVWFCGAGTSAYIGDIIAAGLPFDGAITYRSVPSTDIVARPAYYLSGRENTLIVNFGRSGNSTETLGTLDAVRALAPDLPMLNITCNADGALAKSVYGKAIVLPDACHDAGFAMTSSFSTMLLTALAIFDHSADPVDQISKLADLAGGVLSGLANQLETSQVPNRAVFVGAGPMAFAARESALKVMELSAGQVPCLWDSSLGFRHGPKSFVTENTLIHVLLSSDKDAVKYDRDLVEELKTQFPEATTLTIGAEGDLQTGTTGSDVWDAVLAVIPAQLMSVLWSAQLGLNIDDPFVGMSTLSRVVSGVRLHPIEAK